jgi:hypothetical protein
MGIKLLHQTKHMATWALACAMMVMGIKLLSAMVMVVVVCCIFLYNLKKMESKEQRFIVLVSV